MFNILKPKKLNLWRGYNNGGDRKRAMSMLKKYGFNYFVYYRDTQSDYALLASHVDWLPEGKTYTCR